MNTVAAPPVDAPAIGWCTRAYVFSLAFLLYTPEDWLAIVTPILVEAAVVLTAISIANRVYARHPRRRWKPAADRRDLELTPSNRTRNGLGKNVLAG